MADYQAYVIGADGHFESAVQLDWTDDDVAKQQAKQLVDGYDVELWQRDRKLAILDRKAKPPSADDG
jgi:hypothetical protein